MSTYTLAWALLIGVIEVIEPENPEEVAPLEQADAAKEIAAIAPTTQDVKDRRCFPPTYVMPPASLVDDWSPQERNPPKPPR
jgi:hypothetical protein